MSVYHKMLDMSVYSNKKAAELKKSVKGPIQDFKKTRQNFDSNY